jgi:hypothetical protein
MRGGGRLAEQAFIVYRLTGKDEERRSIQYFGSVEVYEQQLRQEAADLRVTWHLSKRLRCLEGLIGKTAKAEVLSNRLPLSEALALEAAHTVVAHQADPTSRGGPYCLKRLHDKDEQELKDLAEICDIASWITKVSRLQTLVPSWKSTSSMKRHLSNSCYKCGAKNWKTCLGFNKPAATPQSDGVLPQEPPPHPPPPSPHQLTRPGGGDMAAQSRFVLRM